MIVLDDLQTDAARSPRVREIVRQFIEDHLGPGDVAAVVHTSGRPDVSQSFTRNRRLLVEAADAFVGRKSRSATLEELDGIRMSNPNAPEPDPRLARTADPLEAERGYRARATLDTLRKASELMAAARGRRKALLHVSDGVDYDTQGVVAQTRSRLSF